MYFVFSGGCHADEYTPGKSLLVLIFKSAIVGHMKDTTASQLSR